jgi:hypothetical protein
VATTEKSKTFLDTFCGRTSRLKRHLWRGQWRWWRLTLWDWHSTPPRRTYVCLWISVFLGSVLVLA